MVKILLLFTLSSALLYADKYMLLMSKNDKVCHHMGSIYNSDLAKYNKVVLQNHKEYNWLSWDNWVFLKRQSYYKDTAGFGIKKFDINNDGIDENILFRRRPISIYRLEHIYDELVCLSNDKIINYSNQTTSLIYKNNLIYHEALSSYKLNKFPLQKKNEGLHMNGNYNIRPFRIDNQYYLSFFGNIGTDTRAKLPEDKNSIIVTKYDENNTMRNVCYFLRPKPADTINRDKQLEKLSHTFRFSKIPEERLKALKNIKELLPRSFEYSLIKQHFYKLALKAKDIKIKHFALNNLEINEESIILLLNMMINEPNDEIKLSAFYSFSPYFTENGSDPTQFYYVIDENIDLALKAHESIMKAELDRNYYRYPVGMIPILSSGLRFCDTIKYKNSKLVYDKFKDWMVSWDKEPYEKCISEELVSPK